MAFESFGKLLRTHRLRLGLTQEGVAEQAGLSAQAIQKLERGATHPYRDTTNRLVRALGLSADDEAEFRRLHPAAGHRAAACEVCGNSDGEASFADAAGADQADDAVGSELLSQFRQARDGAGRLGRQVA